jgi:amino-acid N-acetyltransferase
MEIIIQPAKPSDWNAVSQLLQENKLPVDDVDKNLSHFFVATIKHRIVGAIGLEKYGDYALLRSMATSSLYRNQGIASKLVSDLFRYAQSIGLKEVYLLTETARDYFEKKSFQIVQRSEVPAVLQQSAEFSHVCPASAIAMKKSIKENLS